MRILQLTNKPPWPDKDGGAIAMLNLTRGFYRLGHEVTILSMNTLKHHTRKEEIPPEVRKLADFRFAEVPAPVSPLSALGNLLFSRLPYNAVRFISGSYRNALTSLLKEKDFDIVQLEGLYLCPYIPLIRAHSKALIAYRAHNIEAEIWQRTAALTSGLKKVYLQILSRRIALFEQGWINRYDLLVPITGRDNQILSQMGNRRPSLVTLSGIEPPDPALLTGETEYPSLFHLGSLEWAPNQEGLLWFLKGVWEGLSAKHPGLRLYVAGRNAPAWLVEKLKQPGVVYLGEVESAPSFMHSKAIMLVPLLSGSGMRVKIAEGMALGKAIISTTLGAEGLPVTDGTHLLLADDAPAFAQAIERVIGNHELCLTLGRNAALLAGEHLDNLTIARRLADFYLQNLN